jgi:hypothetical protein
MTKVKHSVITRGKKKGGKKEGIVKAHKGHARIQQFSALGWAHKGHARIQQFSALGWAHKGLVASYVFSATIELR